MANVKALRQEHAWSVFRRSRIPVWVEWSESRKGGGLRSETTEDQIMYVLVSHCKAFGFSLSEIRGSHWRILYGRVT